MEDVDIEEMRQLEDEHWWFVGKRLLVASLLEPALRRGELRILDVGCGTGGVLAHLRRQARTIAVDSSPLALTYCRRRGIAHVVCGRADQLPFGRERFDVILMLDVLEHCADETSVLSAVRRLLRPDGTLLVSVPAFQFLWTRHDEILQHLRRYTARGLRQALDKGGFTVERLTYTNVAPLLPALVVRGLLARFGLWGSGGRTDFRLHRPSVNQALVGVYRVEALALRRGLRLPAGLSVAALARPSGARAET